MICATAFTLPAATKTKAIMIVTSEALTGSPSDFLPYESHLLTFFDGKEESRARA